MDTTATRVSAAPLLDAGMRGFIVNKARREYWRVSGLLDFEDLVQEGLLCYWRCYKRYSDPQNRSHPDKPLTASWLQALVGRAFDNRIHDLASKKRYGFAVPASEVARPSEAPEAVLEEAVPAVSETGALLTALALAPRELVELVRLLAGDGTQALGFRRERGAARETTNEYYCRLLGLAPSERDVVQELREHFGV